MSTHKRTQKRSSIEIENERKLALANMSEAMRERQVTEIVKTLTSDPATLMDVIDGCIGRGHVDVIFGGIIESIGMDGLMNALLDRMKDVVLEQVSLEQFDNAQAWVRNVSYLQNAHHNMRTKVWNVPDSENNGTKV